jgi:gamma-glutamylcyclotransferase (GGCT)/AIG2-like uncharacterized protein YtfP
MHCLMLPLFAYGTLRDPEYQRELFGRTYAMQPATVDDFAVVSTGGGYLAATASPGAMVRGALVALDEAAYAIADEWEDLAVYERIETDARLANGVRQRCCMYERAGVHGPAVTDERTADRSRAAVIEDIRRFRAEAGLTPRP